MTKEIVMKKRIGSTTYEVRAFFNPEAKETAEQKILRIIKNDLKFYLQYGIMELPQTVRLSERSSA